MIFGIYVSVSAVTNLDIGDSVYWGPGYFPMLLGGGLALLGSILTVRSIFEEQEWISPVKWWSLLLICGSPIFFAVFIERLGLVPTLFGTGLMSGLAQPEAGFLKAAATALGILVVCLIVFVFGLNMNVALLGTWFGVI